VVDECDRLFGSGRGILSRLLIFLNLCYLLVTSVNKRAMPLVSGAGKESQRDPAPLDYLRL
jgi:hypothetical protein